MEGFLVVGEIDEVETIAEGNSIRDLPRLLKVYGFARWRKRKGYAMIELSGGSVKRAEVHWYEAHGIGKRELKIKRFMD